MAQTVSDAKASTIRSTTRLRLRGGGREEDGSSMRTAATTCNGSKKEEPAIGAYSSSINGAMPATVTRSTVKLKNLPQRSSILLLFRLFSFKTGTPIYRPSSQISACPPLPTMIDDADRRSSCFLVPFANCHGSSPRRRPVAAEATWRTINQNGGRSLVPTCDADESGLHPIIIVLVPTRRTSTMTRHVRLLDDRLRCNASERSPVRCLTLSLESSLL